MKIKETGDDFLAFDNGDVISTDYSRQCSEHNYADFNQIDDIARGYDFKPPILFRKEDYGFSFGDSRRMFFVPCYSEQNGYYANEIDVYYNEHFKFTTVGEITLG